MYHAVQAGRLAEARQWQHRLAPLIKALFAEPNPAVVKQALHEQGWLSGAVRPPMLRASDASLQGLRSAWSALEGHPQAHGSSV
jgi:4-hydroxy-tetrahydrodipicolinate synthase